MKELKFKFGVGDKVTRIGYQETPLMTVETVAVDRVGNVYVVNWYDDNGGHFSMWLREDELSAFGK